MQTAAKPVLRLGARWRTARRLYPIYAAIAAEFGLPEPPYQNLQEVDEGSEPEVITAVERWLAETDQRVRAQHFRHLLQNTDFATSEPKLSALVERYLQKPDRTESDRDKLDFLLAHYLAVCAPPSFHDRKLEIEDVADVLEGVLGECSTVVPESLAPLQELVRATEGVLSLRGFVESRIIERGRALKVASGERYFASSSLVAFARFNYVVRRTYLRLVDADLAAVRAGLCRLKELGVDLLDCRTAAMGMEPLNKLQQVVEGWQRPRMTEYRNDQPFRMLMDLRSVVEAAVVEHGTAATRERLAALERQVAALAAELRQVSAQLAALKAKPHAGAAGVAAAGSDFELSELFEVPVSPEGRSPARPPAQTTEP